MQITVVGADETRERRFLFRVCDYIDVAQRARAGVGDVVFGLGWAIESSVGFDGKPGAIAERHFTLTFKDDQQFLILLRAMFAHRFAGREDDIA